MQPNPSPLLRITLKEMMLVEGVSFKTAYLRRLAVRIAYGIPPNGRVSSTQFCKVHNLDESVVVQMILTLRGAKP